MEYARCFSLSQEEKAVYQEVLKGSLTIVDFPFLKDSKRKAVKTMIKKGWISLRPNGETMGFFPAR